MLKLKEYKVKAKYIFIMQLTFLVFIVSCSKQSKNKEFILKGSFEGNNTKQIILRYTDHRKNRIIDTISIHNKKFFTKGFINGPTYVSLIGNRKSMSADDPNSVWVFIEPKRIDISLTEDKFKEIKVEGSITQTEYENLEKQVKSIYSEIRPLMLERNELDGGKNINDKDSVAINKRINNIDTEWEKKLNKIAQIRLNFCWNNPNSYLSAFWVQQHFKKIPFDSTHLYYENFNSDVKNSLYGINITDLIKKRQPIMIGDLAPEFEAKGFKEGKINLELFKDKYVLLDFWAGWCKPCRENNPYLRNLYKEYNHKGLEIIGISLDDDKKSWKEAIAKDSISSWNHIFMGRKGSIVTQYNINEIPDYILIDRKGYIIGRKSPEKEFNLNNVEKKLIEIFN